MRSSPLPITGAGLVTAAGIGVAPAWEALCARRSFLVLDPDSELAGFAPIRTARCGRIDPESLGADRRAAKLMRGHTHMLLAAVHDALRDAPLAPEMAGAEVAFFAGMDSVDPASDDLMGAVHKSGAEVNLRRFFGEEMDRIPPLWPLELLNAIGFSQVAIQHQLQGENAVFSAGPEAGARAICEAAASVRLGKARLGLAAGVSGRISARMLARAAMSGALPGAWGLGEGAAVVLFGETVQPEGIRGWLKGQASVRALARRGGLARAIQRSAETALSLAGLRPDEVDLLVICGEGRAEADRAEAEALSAIFKAGRPLLLATKGVFGHLWGASPALDLIIAAKALAEGEVPPPHGIADEAFQGVERTSGRREMRDALLLLQGFGGVCAAFVVGKNP